MNKYPVKILTPTGIAFEGDIAGLYLRGAAGDLAVFAGHIPFVTSVREGRCTIVYGDDDKEDTEAKIGSGMLNVTHDGVNLLVGTFEVPKE